MYEVSVSPHIKDEDTVASIMWNVVLALLPALGASIYYFGVRALYITLTCVIFAVLTEGITRKLRKRDNTVTDGSAVVTGILLAFVIPPTSPLWMAAIGAVLAIFLVKELFGGLGMNIFNPALASRAILLAAFPRQMTDWISPDAVTSATPLAMVKEEMAVTLPTYTELFLGKIGGCIGETSALAIILGGLFLMSKRIIKWQVPVIFIGGVFVFSLLFGRDPVFEILAGGVMLGAFFMLTDMVTTPITTKGNIIFALGCALITCLIRKWGGYPEGVCYSILIMNACVPLIDQYTRPRCLGAA